MEALENLCFVGKNVLEIKKKYVVENGVIVFIELNVSYLHFLIKKRFI